MARSNFQYHKRQKELARKQKQEEKKQRKLEKSAADSQKETDPIAEKDENC
jgi:hypothetical protein